MDYFREKYRAGVIDTKTYDKMMEVIFHLEEKNYSFIEELGCGSFGYVLKMNHSCTKEDRAIKIVSKHHASEGETELWSTLNHQNILPLLSLEYVYFADSYIFITPAHPMNLEQVVLKSSLLAEKGAFDKIINWNKQILNATEYLHGKSLCHLDLKCNNILLSEDKQIIIADFGFLSSTQKPIRRYGCPIIYRCPEARAKESGVTEVNGKSFDVFAIGTMAFEIFTGMSLLREASNWHSLVNWHAQVYPVLQDSLQKRKFTELMCKTFPLSKKIKHKAENVISFITACLASVPEKRPSVQQLQNHRLFGGTFQNVTLEPHEDIWSKKVSAQELNSIFEKKTSKDIQLEKITKEADNNNTNEPVHSNERASDFKVVNSSLQNCAEDKTANAHEDVSIESNKIASAILGDITYFINTSQIETRSPVNLSSLKDSNKEMACGDKGGEFCLSELSVVKSDKSKQSPESYIKSNPDINNYIFVESQIESPPAATKSSLQYSIKEIDKEFHLSDLDIVENHNSEKSIVKSDVDINLCVTPQRNSTEMSSVIPPNYDNSSKTITSPDTTQKKTSGRNIGLWWKKRKSRLVRIFTACMCCAKSPKTCDE